MSTHIPPLDRIYAFNEPHCMGGNALVTVTGHQAVAWMRRTGDYSASEYALDVFLAVHWAWEAEDQTQPVTRGIPHWPEQLSGISG